MTALQMSTPHPGWAEQDPEAWWQATLASIRTVLAAKPGARGRVDRHLGADALVGLSRRAGRRDSSRAALVRRTHDRRVPRDHGARGRRGAAARSRVQSGARGIHAAEGALAAQSRARGVRATARPCCSPKDFIRYRLTGALATEPSDASATLMYDTARLRWSTEILDAVGLPHSIVPDVGGSSDVLGNVTVEAAGLTGLQVGTPVVGGGADNACGAAGVGAVVPGEAVTSWGTSGTVLAPTSEPRVDPGLRAHTFCHVAPGDVVSDGRRAVGGRRVRLVSRPTRARSGEHRRGERAAQRRSGDDSARRRGRDVPAVSPGRAHAASRRVACAARSSD